MARKKVVITDEELKPIVLMTKKEKRGSVLWIIFIFAIFIAVAIYLPDITLYVNNYLNNGDITTNIPNNPVDEDNDEEEVEEIEEYNISSDLKIEMEEFDFSNIVVENDTISFSVTNKTENMLEFSSLNYFVNLYTSGKMLIQRIMLRDTSIAPSETKILTYDLKSSNPGIISISKITVDEYPAHIVNTDDAGNGTLKCQKDYEVVSYLLKDNKVYAIDDVFQVEATDANYSSLYSSYVALSTTYNSINGITSSVNVENNLLTFSTSINLNYVTENAFNSKIYYPLNTDAKVMNFELEASGYTCN